MIGTRQLPPLFFVSVLFFLPSAVHAHAGPHTSHSQLPSTWYHPPDHPAHALFRRADLYTDGHQYAEVGSPAWSAGYPTDAPDPNNLPQAWRDALGAAVSAGKIPNIPLPTHNNDYPAYPEGYDPNGPQVCSSYYQCRGDDDIWDAPDGVIGISFDDGPLEPSPGLYDFLKNNNMTATHFFIGQNILQNPHLFQQAYEYGGDIAVHTWSHPYMSTMTNEQVLGELGWTMQIIHNSTGGRLPRYWRPPYGDSDSRVRAIAKEVFGLTAIIWNHDTEDWAITEGGTTVEAAQSSMTQWISGPKSPGLIILEHELSQQSVTVFTDSFPSMKANGWKVASVAQIAFPKFGSTPYQNAVATSTTTVASQSKPSSSSSTHSPSHSPSASSGQSSLIGAVTSDATRVQSVGISSVIVPALLAGISLLLNL